MAAARFATQGLKPALFWSVWSARVNSCPDTKRMRFAHLPTSAKTGQIWGTRRSAHSSQMQAFMGHPDNFQPTQAKIGLAWGTGITFTHSSQNRACMGHPAF